MRRRDFIKVIAVLAAAWPLRVRAQQPTMPLVGFLDNRSPDAPTDLAQAFRQGLKDAGYTDGENMAIEYRWGENQVDRLQELAADLVRRKVAVIAAGSTPRHSPPRPRPQQFRLYSLPRTIRSSLV